MKNRWNSTLKRKVQGSNPGGGYALQHSTSGFFGGFRGGVQLAEIMSEFETIKRMFETVTEQSETAPRPVSLSPPCEVSRVVVSLL